MKLIKTKPLLNLNIDCNSKRAYCSESLRDYERRNKRIGHLVRLSFCSIQKELKRDLEVVNPENPQEKIWAAGLLDYIFWSRDEKETIGLGFQASFQNKAEFFEALCMLEDVEVEVEFVVYDFDYSLNKYFKSFYTRALSLKLEKNVSGIDEEFNTDISPSMIFFRFRFASRLSDTCKNQTVHYSFSANGMKFDQKIETAWED